VGRRNRYDEGVPDTLPTRVRRRRRLIISLLLSPAAVAFAAAPASQPATAPSLLGYRPITYFQDHCANCHGDYGSTYDPAFNAKLSDAQLAGAIRTMAEGPGRAPLTEEQVRVQVAYHRTLGEAKPFVTVAEVRREADALHLSGDVSPEATVRVTVGERTIQAEVTEHEWTAVLRPVPVGNVVITATSNGDTISTSVP